MGLKPIILEIPQWEDLKRRLKTDYPPSWIMIRGVMKTRLGFTVREHTEYRDTRAMAADFGVAEYGDRRQPYRMICLDFFDERKRTMFLLKYSDWIKQ